MIKTNLKKSMKLLAGYFFRWMGFSDEPDLLKIGTPNEKSPVFLTCNFNITVKRVLNALKGLDCYLLVAPSNGINVWCGACGDDFLTDSVVSILKTSGIDKLVTHRTLILPQLSAPGIDPILLKKKTGWNAKFGPVYAKDIPDYLENNYFKTDSQRKIEFPIKKRIEMGNLYFFSIFILFSIIYGISSIFSTSLNNWMYLGSILIIITTIYGPLVLLSSISIRTGKLKVLIYELIIAVILLSIYISDRIETFQFFWYLILSIFCSMMMAEDFHGLTPLNKSELGEKSWNSGKDKFKFLFSEYKLQPYGNISLIREKCIGCKVCIEVCPMNLYIFNETDKKVDLVTPDKCINCNACVKRCLTQCLIIE